jgi:hypothetical protein
MGVAREQPIIGGVVPLCETCVLSTVRQCVCVLVSKLMGCKKCFVVAATTCQAKNAPSTTSSDYKTTLINAKTCSESNDWIASSCGEEPFMTDDIVSCRQFRNRVRSGDIDDHLAFGMEKNNPTNHISCESRNFYFDGDTENNNEEQIVGPITMDLQLKPVSTEVVGGTCLEPEGRCRWGQYCDCEEGGGEVRTNKKTKEVHMRARNGTGDGENEMPSKKTALKSLVRSKQCWDLAALGVQSATSWYAGSAGSCESLGAARPTPVFQPTPLSHCEGSAGLQHARELDAFIQARRLRDSTALTTGQL